MISVSSRIRMVKALLPEENEVIALSRLPQINNCTFGTMQFVGSSLIKPFFHTLELPWKMNERNVSCIPTGVYKTDQHLWSVSKTPVPILLDVPDRECILIHYGNTTSDILGCILLGTSLGVCKNKWAVLNSQAALKALGDLISPEFVIVVTNLYGHSYGIDFLETNPGFVMNHPAELTDCVTRAERVVFSRWVEEFICSYDRIEDDGIVPWWKKQ